MKRILIFAIGLAVAMCFSCMPAFAEGEQGECAHQWSEWTVSQESTCIEQGKQTRTCSLCNQTEEEALPLADHNWSEWAMDYDADCTQSGQLGRYCLVCGTTETQVIEPKGHAWGDWEIVTPSTPYHKGEKCQTCKRCGEKQTATIAKRKATAKEKAAMKVVTRFFKASKYHNTPNMKKCFAKCSNSYFAAMNTKLGEWSKEQNKSKMSCTVKDVSTSGKYVTVKVKVKYANGYNTFYKAYEKWYEWYLDNPEETEEAIEEKLASMLNKDIKKKGTIKSTKTIELKCKHTSRGWKIVKPNKELRNMVECYFQKATDDFRTDYDMEE